MQVASFSCLLAGTYGTMHTVYTHLGSMTFPTGREAESFFVAMLQVVVEDNGWAAWGTAFFDAGRRVT